MTEFTFGRPGAGLLHGIAELFGDYADLVQKEIRLARAEIVEAVSRQVRASAVLAGAGFLALVAFFLIVEGIVFAIAAAGLALYWSCFLVALVLIAGAGGLYAYARSAPTSGAVLARSLEQIQCDIRTVKEQAT
jgi:hypothetical protein